MWGGGSARQQVVPIDDPDDERLADYRHLTDAALRRRHERTDAHGPGICIAESRHVVRTVLASSQPVRSVLLTPSALVALGEDLRHFAGAVYVAEQHVMSQVAGFPVHRGALACVERPHPRQPAELLTGATAPVAVLEGVTDHENLGVIFRTAAALGISGVLLSPTSGDPLYRRSLRVSMGHALRVPFVRLTPWPGALDEVRRGGFTLVGLTPDEAAQPIRSLDPASVGRVALVLGSEGDGLTPGATARVDRHVRIPMAGGVDSLNVATAAAIAFHHFADLS